MIELETKCSQQKQIYYLYILQNRQIQKSNQLIQMVQICHFL